ncbi:STAS domain-containing protein [Dolichospermum sp. LEGE 00240]|jgi:anti-anti-sigma factor|uniref:STAS domain-containing protein n=1 Tax=Dolichospermum sp. LEGE 00240 TaxID=1828603 RepID=UPI001881ADBA|nr:STAS domain-containing protein [Dolichospermum sp. LEGE 00240]MDM3846744.1 STAS domain-containing protein [Aphanizomenon gracile PMC638.10]MDM3850874.1 STAS domain-containing protein [Aphanizomenon gracile PMC627.10]MDM3853997.1 STAS domain-containing protein [Aphanizomenon gracile PMC649.10]MDM3858739.1 STAS domain-containing protein [Aphanizomenon gracile PMC644.10]MBE9249037.1 STAS domain-containing protein [Dolichospermum sp. LEGE 00240]
MNQQVKVISISGSFNANNSQSFRESITESMDSGTSIVLVDCHNVTFMDSSGLGTLVLTFKALEESGIKMVICSINEQVRMLFELTGIDSKFTIVPSKEAFENLLISAT